MKTFSDVSRFSRRAGNLEASPIREILTVIDRPGMISFAGGLPAPETFPAMNLANVPAKWLQYGPSEGDPELRQCIAENLNELGLKCSPEQVLILSGSQQGIDLVGKLFIDNGTPVAVESPTYLAALQVFRYFGARFTPLNPQLPSAGLAGEPRPAFAYAIPTFQNPTGHCYAAAERAALAEACDQFAVPLFEDDPYRDLAYDEVERTPVCAQLQRASWIYQGSFSKSLAPGLRLGYLVASPDLLTPLVRLKQAADLHSNRISQWYVLGQLQDAARDRRIAELADFYRRKRDLFGRELDRHFNDLATWRVPAGGLFFWLQLKARIDTRLLLPQAIQHNVAFMPGEPFFPERPAACGALRLNFSHADEEQIRRGLATLAELLAAALGRPGGELRRAVG
ncbi:MAG: putative aminotransferase [Proteobacteria bacterium]|nr:putative aminotransferase [Pseudomonadota bacterium]